MCCAFGSFGEKEENELNQYTSIQENLIIYLLNERENTGRNVGKKRCVCIIDACVSLQGR